MSFIYKKKGAKRWRYRTTRNGRAIDRSLLTESARVAEKRRQLLDDELALERLGIQKRVALKPILLSDFFEQYFKYAESFKKASTLKNERAYAKRFTEFVKDREIATIDAKMLDMWKAEILGSKAPATFNIVRRFLHAAFNTAVKWNYLAVNPMSQVSKAKSEEKRLYMTLDEFGRLLKLLDADIIDPAKKHLAKSNVLFRSYIEFLLLTGLRRQEAIGLKKDNVDLNLGVLFITQTKGRRDRVVPLHPRAKEILSSLGQDLFGRLRPTTVSHKFKALCVRAGLSGNFKLHSLRHSTGTMLNEKGVDITAIQSILGHADIRTTLIYSKVSVEKLKKDISTLDIPSPVQDE